MAGDGSDLTHEDRQRDCVAGHGEQDEPRQEEPCRLGGDSLEYDMGREISCDVTLPVSREWTTRSHK